MPSGSTQSSDQSLCRAVSGPDGTLSYGTGSTQFQSSKSMRRAVSYGAELDAVPMSPYGHETLDVSWIKGGQSQEWIEYLDVPVSRDPAVEDKEEHPNGWHYSGFQPVGKFHKFNRTERRVMSNFECIDYHEGISQVYKDYLHITPPMNPIIRWVVMAMVGVAIGWATSIVKQSIQYIEDQRIALLEHRLGSYGPVDAWLHAIIFRGGLVIMSAVPVVFIAPVAAGSGIPEVMGYLNGVLMPKVFNIRTLFAKMASAIFAVASGLPVGPEGPLIHIGSILGAGISQARSRTLRMATVLPFCRRLQSHKRQYEFIVAGCAAGVASAFGAPIGGLLFVVEEIAGHWDPNSAWRIFFCCLMSVFTTQCINSYFHAWSMREEFSFPWMDPKAVVMFTVQLIDSANMLVVIPAAVLGAFCGFLGGIFTLINLRLAHARRTANRSGWHKVRQISEVFALSVVWTTIVHALPELFPCIPYTPTNIAPESAATMGIGCPGGMYNPMAILTYGTGEAVVQGLFMRGSTYFFPISQLLMYVMLYFIFTAVCSGSCLATGFVIPMLVIGSLVGRIVGIVLCSWCESFGWGTSFVDAGVLAFLGAAAFFAGVSRLSISLTVIMLETTNDVPHLVPLMVACMTARAVADYISHPLYHALLQVKCVPFLDESPALRNLALFTAADVMAAELSCLMQHASVQSIMELLENTTHGHFPIIDDEEKRNLKGTISRHHLEILLSQSLRRLKCVDVRNRYKGVNLGSTSMGSMEFGDSVVSINQEGKERMDLTVISRDGSAISEYRDTDPIRQAAVVNDQSVSQKRPRKRAKSDPITPSITVTDLATVAQKDEGPSAVGFPETALASGALTINDDLEGTIPVVPHHGLVEDEETSESDSRANTFGSPYPHDLGFTSPPLGDPNRPVNLTFKAMMQIREQKSLLPPTKRAPKLPPEYKKIVIDLDPYMNSSPWTVPHTFALNQLYQMFKSLRLRYMVVQDGYEVVGIITRKDLLGHNLDKAMRRTAGLERTPSSASLDR